MEIVESLRQLRALVGLRYRLILAQARTSQGRVAVLFALYLLGGMVALFMALGGVGMAVAGVKLGREESITRWVLTGLCANGFGLSLLFGFGARAIFAEESLRRYPLPASRRFVIRHWIGLLDPVWLLLAAAALGLVAGLGWLGVSGAGYGLVAVLLFIPAVYLATALLLAVIGVAMRTRAGTTIFGGLLVLSLSFGPLVFVSLEPEVQRLLGRMADGLLRWLPPGLAATAMTAGRWKGRLIGFGGLAIWVSGLAWLLRALERRSERQSKGQVALAAGDGRAAALREDTVWQIARIFGGRFAPLVDKSLRYHLRCNLIRYSLITSPLLVVAIRFLNTGEQRGGFIFNSALIFYVLSCATGAAMMLNLFGFDGAGVRRYALLPTAMGDALRAGSIASLILRLAVLLVSFVFWLVVFRGQARDWRGMALLIGLSLGGTLLFNGLGLWLSILAPKRADFDLMWNNRLSLGANVVVILGVLLPFYAGQAIVTRYGSPVLLRYWWAGLLFPIPGGLVYAVSFLFIDPALRLRRDLLLRDLSGTR